ncbi:hypothetical protein F441_16435 [Phytophthora nicotianae CJ01A1]|uniref:Jacalin-type lectin domain-containing protein n=1 Tax=Phytophthora nicotianae CJ01A1 TaxID=1317063 RepID=W2W9X6_PHYNI|nr:hypothetical protein F441_16435 [Phytophthora nicotianae CJ01A1]
MYIEFTTDAGNTISAGSPTDKIGKDSAPEGYQLGGFVGYSGNELDSEGDFVNSRDLEEVYHLQEAAMEEVAAFKHRHAEWREVAQDEEHSDVSEALMPV